MLLGYQTVRDGREIANRTPLILVQGDVINNYLAAGGERFSHGNELDQNVGELTANLTFNAGAKHQITVGTHNELFEFRNLFANNRFGTWTFGNADSLEAGLARRYEIQLESRPGRLHGGLRGETAGRLRPRHLAAEQRISRSPVAFGSTSRLPTSRSRTRSGL